MRLILFVLLIAFFSLPVFAVQAQGSIAWRVDFWNDIFLAGPPHATRIDNSPSLAYHWGAGTPIEGIRANHFGVRWGADVYFTEGTYRFTVQADDAVKIALDFAPILDTLDQPRSGMLLTTDLVLTEGTHHFQVDYNEYNDDAYLYFYWEDITDLPPLAHTNDLWIGQYFDNPSLSGVPKVVRWDDSPTQDWGTGSPAEGIPADNFSVRWTGVQALAAGTYRFEMNVDDGVRLYVDDQLLYNQFHAATGRLYSGAIPLEGGLHTVVIEYFDGAENAKVFYDQFAAIMTPPVTDISAVVTSPVLNVRSAPDLINGALVTRGNEGESYPVIGRNADSSWWQVSVIDTTGWIKPDFVTVNNLDGVPLIPSLAQNLPTQAPASCPNAPDSHLTVGGQGRFIPGADTTLWIIPDFTGSTSAGLVPPDAAFSVLNGPVCLGRVAWWLLRYENIIGWTAEATSDTYWVEVIQ